MANRKTASGGCTITESGENCVTIRRVGARLQNLIMFETGFLNQCFLLSLQTEQFSLKLVTPFFQEGAANPGSKE